MFRRRVNILLGAFLLVGLVLLARLGQIQIGWHDRFSTEDYTRAGGSHLVETLRGGIYTRWGTPLASQVPSFDLGVYYGSLDEEEWMHQVAAVSEREVRDLANRAEQVRRRVERMEEYIRAEQLEREGKADIRVAERYRYHPVAEDLPVEVATLIRTQPWRFPTVQTPAGEAPAVKVLERTARRYPQGSLAPHIVGRTSLISAEKWEELLARGTTWTMGEPFSAIGSRYKMDDRLGTNGMEKACENMLRGDRGYVRNHLEFKLLGYEKVSTGTEPEPGLDVYLTMREDFQRAANQALQRAAGEGQLAFKAGALVVVDVQHGSVLAAATWPTYRRESLRRKEEYEDLRSDPLAPLLFRPVQAALPTGSVYKVVTAIAALEERAITPSSTFTCRKRKVFPPGRAFHCTGRHGTVALLTAIEKSCNIYFYNTGLAAGGEALAEWGQNLGLGRSTGLDLPFEREGQVPTPKSTYGVLNLSIGQGKILCTPLQVANAMACVANGGRLNTPHFFDHARDADGKVVRRYAQQARETGVSTRTLQTVREGMRRVVESGTARYAGLDYFRVAGKTGTAELGNGRPNHAWFAGYAPHDDPKVAFAVVSELTPGHGGSHAAPIVGYMLEQIWDAVETMP